MSTAKFEPSQKKPTPSPFRSKLPRKTKPPSSLPNSKNNAKNDNLPLGKQLPLPPVTLLTLRIPLIPSDIFTSLPESDSLRLLPSTLQSNPIFLSTLKQSKALSLKAPPSKLFHLPTLSGSSGKNTGNNKSTLPTFKSILLNLNNNSTIQIEIESTTASTDNNVKRTSYSEIEEEVASSILIREGHLLRLRSLTLKPTSIEILNGEDENETSTLLTRMSDLLSLVRQVSMSLTEALANLRSSESSNGGKQVFFKGTDYILTMTGSLDYLDRAEYRRLQLCYLGRSHSHVHEDEDESDASNSTSRSNDTTFFTRNPLVLKRNLNDRIESIRKEEGLHSLLPSSNNTGDDCSNNCDEDFSDVGRGSGGGGGIKSYEEVYTNYSDDDDSVPPQTPTHSLNPTNTRLRADEALTLAKSTLLAYNTIHVSPVKNASSPFSKYVSIRASGIDESRRLLAAERVILQEEGIFGITLNSLDGFEFTPEPSVVSRDAPEDDSPIQENQIHQTLRKLNTSLTNMLSHRVNLELHNLQLKQKLPSLKLSLYWSQRILKQLQIQSTGGDEGVDSQTSLENLPWTSCITTPDFENAWNNRNGEFRRKMENNEMLRVDRFAFTSSFDICQHSILVLEEYIDRLQGGINHCESRLGDIDFNVKAKEYKIKQTEIQLNTVTTHRHQLVESITDNWRDKKRQNLPLSIADINEDRDIHKSRMKQKHEEKWWIDKFTRPKTEDVGLESVNIDNPHRGYARGWVSEEQVNAELAILAARKAEVKQEAEMKFNKNKAKYAPATVYQGGSVVSGVYCLVTIQRYPAKAYNPAAVSINCLLVNADARVTANFNVDVLSEFSKLKPNLIEDGIEIENDGYGEAQKWSKWIEHLRLKRDMLYTGKPRGKIKLVWRINNEMLEGDVDFDCEDGGGGFGGGESELEYERDLNVESLQLEKSKVLAVNTSEDANAKDDEDGEDRGGSQNTKTELEVKSKPSVRNTDDDDIEDGYEDDEESSTKSSIPVRVIFKQNVTMNGVESLAEITHISGVLKLLVTPVSVASDTNKSGCEIEITEESLVKNGWITLSSQVANSSEEGLKSICEDVVELVNVDGVEMLKIKNNCSMKAEGEEAKGKDEEIFNLERSDDEL